MSVLVTADLHLTDRPQDRHRWDLFPWLEQQAEKYAVSKILLLGDVTDAKDRHSAALTNQMSRALARLADAADVYVLRGNHDYIDENEPFFAFIRNFGAPSHVIDFIVTPTELHDAELGDLLLLPNTRDYQTAWAKLKFEDYDWIFTHQTYDGCLTENGAALPGIPPSVFRKTKARVISGDIHVPQAVSRHPMIEYVGAPYRIRFGDAFAPRVLLIEDNGALKDLHFPTKNKMTVDWDPKAGLGKSGARPGDQVKVRVTMRRTDYPEWPEIRRKIIAEAREMELELTGPELIAAPERQNRAAKGSGKPAGGHPPQAALAAYAERKGLGGAILAAGEGLLKEALD